MLPPKDTVYDLVGLGFGPANIAVAGALVEKWESEPEAKISFMKDLATLRSPQSPITFLAYLHSENRLLPFINRGSTIPTRKEFADYLAWAAKYVQNHGVEVQYGHRVVGLEERQDGTIDVRIQDNATKEETVIVTRNVIISPGGSPRMPEVISSLLPHPSIIHSSEYATSIARILGKITPSSRPIAVAVVGSGQSAAEVTMDLRERLSALPLAEGASRGHHVDMIVRKGSLKPSDDSPFANEIFDPCATDAWFTLPFDHMRSDRHAEYKNTNYGVVNPRTLEQLYEIIYDQRLDDGIANREKCACSSHKPRINVRSYSSIVAVQPSGDKTALQAIIQHAVSRTAVEKSYDIIVCATGYERTAWQSLLTQSNLGQKYGLTGASGTIQLAPESARPLARVTNQLHMHIDRTSLANGETPASSDSESDCETPLTSPPPSTPDAQSMPQTLYVSRNYCLMPVPEGGWIV
ncbi:hypothetical protein ONZ45_g3326 [Pleurotus djamor]|nr:hypothetical protein ONZ45_g3326 [Pleurotus djamor]